MDLFIIAAEPSADLLAKSLVEELWQEKASLTIGAVSGPLLRTTEVKTLFLMEDLQVMGFVDVLLALPKLLKKFYAIRNKILELNPKAVVLIDYPGFNLKLEESLRKKGYLGKLIHYVSPTIWAWKKKRQKILEKNLDLLLVLFPFEKKYFIKSSLQVEYVGHPLASKKTLPCKEKRKYLTLFPGSRPKEISLNLKIQLEAVEKLYEKDPTLELAISIASKNLLSIILPHLRKTKVPYQLFFPEEKLKLLESTKVAIAKSGTITLELALAQIPTIATYGIKKSDLFIAQKIFKIDLPYYCIVNIILEKRLFPELIGPHLEKDFLFDELKKIWTNPKLQEEMIRGCQELQKILETSNPAKIAAKKIISLAF